MKNIDIVIIGAGPVGLFAGFYAGMRGLSAVIIDKLEVPGGQLAALYPEKEIYDIAGHPEIKAQALVDKLMEQLNRFDKTTSLSLKNEVLNIKKNDDDNFIVTTTNDTYNAKTVIIAAGNGAFAPRKMGVDGEELFSNIHYFVKDMSIFDNKDIVVFGGGDSSVDWSLMLDGKANKVEIVHRRDEFRAHDHSVELLKKSSVGINTPFVPYSLNGENGKVTSVKIQNSKTKEIKTITVDDIICNFGFVSNLGAIKDWDLELDGNKIIVNSMQETNIKGIFAIGDICSYPGKASLIINGFGEAPVAVNSCYLKINPEAIIGALRINGESGGKND